MSYWWLIAFCLGSYLVGCINFSVIISKFKFRDDVRTTGSGNPGATNMLRKFGVKIGFLIVVLDALKGLLPAIIGMLAFGGAHYNISPLTPASNVVGQIGMLACGLSAVLGHCFSVFLKFKGGKGTSTTLGAFLAVNPIAMLLVIVIVLLALYLFDYASVASFFLICVFTIWESAINSSFAVYGILLGFFCVVLFTHRSNIKRLLSCKERPANFLKKK